MNESFSELFEASLTKTEIKPGTIITGKVVDIRSDEVIVSAGLKSEGIINIREFMSDSGELEVKVGDDVEVAVDSLENGHGETRLSREKAKREHSWTELERAHKNDQSVEGVITGKVKGGFTVEINNVRAFLPGSLVDVRPIRDSSNLEGKKLEFKVIKMDRRRNNVVVSRRAIVEDQFSAERQALLQSLDEGMTVKGIVKNLTDYGAFLDLGGVDGLLHITDMAWKRVHHPSEIVSIDQEITVKVLKFDREKNRVSLGLKQLGEDPWVDIKRRYPEGARVFGKVTNIADYGCFVEIEDGVEGLVHVSEMDWTNKNVNPSKVVTLGQEVEVMVLDIDEERRRISLGMKQCHPNPWEEFAAGHSKNDKVKGKIKSITDFGIFIGLEGGIDGLIHLSDLSWDIPGEEAVRNYKKGDELEAVVLSVDPERERISLGVKQLASDPFAAFVAANGKGSYVKGKVIKVEMKAAIVELAEGVEATLRASELSRDRVEDATTVLKEGAEVEAKIISVDRKNRVINISIKAKDSDDEAAVMQGYTRNTASATLGDIMKEQLTESSGDS
ncbi:MAG TPA: 30S ribosomal protein S1 [Gammaproteobacteria bacterium]|nr:30S ribosomal protein S1 [Gammaproteobacteria bacterium]